MSVGRLSAAVARQLQRLRVRAGISTGRLARKAGLSALALRDIEEGRAQPTLGTLGDLAKELGASVAELVQAAKHGAGAPARTGVLSAAQIGKAVVELPGRGDKLEVVEAAAVQYAFAVCDENKSRAARLLGLERKAMERRLDRIRRRTRSSRGRSLRA